MFREFTFAYPEIADDRSERPAVAAGQRGRLLFGFRVDQLTSRGRRGGAHAVAQGRWRDRNGDGEIDHEELAKALRVAKRAKLLL